MNPRTHTRYGAACPANWQPLILGITTISCGRACPDPKIRHPAVLLSGQKYSRPV
ncbi:MAG: hypothetical protein KDK02_16290 [Rhodobacteraceae bacterium]|nr:hypothetical protein [Paracoccaceae bacterium]